MKATEELLKDHKMVRKVLADFHLSNPRFPQLLNTLTRILKAHAWFEDVIFLPALDREPRLKRLDRQISDEHKDLTALLRELHETPLTERPELEFNLIQLRSILETHFKKEEDALFPLAERILDSEGLLQMGDEMHRRRLEVRELRSTE